MKITELTIALTLALIITSLFLTCENKSTVPPPSTDGSLVETVNGYTFEMAVVAGGMFTMGCTQKQESECWDNEKPAHSVTLSSYYIGKHEVTQGVWKAVMGSLPESLTSSSSYGYGDEYPVYYVSWNDITETDGFIRRLNNITGKNYRLPTEAEWEYAARGGASSNNYKYSGSDYIDDVAWYSSNIGNTTHIVGTKLPNELGIYDMSGNVWEWVSDWYGSDTSTAQTDPTGPLSGTFRVSRGGSWSYSAKYCRVSDRNFYDPDNRGGIGFRLVLSVPIVQKRLGG